jgi:hypothetical protein
VPRSGNVTFEQCGGRDLAEFRDRSIDLVLAVDSFPYLFAAGPQNAAQHLRDAARVHRPGGTTVIFNFSYRGDEEADRRDIERLAGANGLPTRRNPGFHSVGRADLLANPSGSPRMKASVLARAS